MRPSSFCKVVGAVVIAAAVILGAGGAASAAPSVSGSLACDLNGNKSVVWTFVNDTAQTATIAKGTVDFSTLTSGSINDANVNFSPSFIVVAGGQGVGKTYLAPNTLGSLSILVKWNAPNGPDQFASATVVLGGACVDESTTTVATTAAPTTAAPTAAAPTAAAPTAAAPTTSAAGSGAGLPTTAAPALPATGQASSSIAFIAALLTALGGALFVVAQARRA